jgi:4-amino-4-deoxy-L-arabinose transferase-like glycosyltransferase
LADEKTARLLLAGSFAIFLSTELSLDCVSRVGPDMLVSCLLFAAMALLLKLRDEPDSSHAILLGVLLGLGYLVKFIFLPLTLLFYLAAAVAMWKKRDALRSLGLIAIFSGLLAMPYIAGVSWAQGYWTLGESGQLNYAWNVNKIEPLGLWQGWPPELGKPMHPALMVSAAPHAYLFDGPFQVTFAPFFDPPYYYRGFRSVFSLRAQAHAVAANVLRLLKILKLQIVFYALAICWLSIRVRNTEPRLWRKTCASLWPALLVCGGGMLTYLLVVIEARYIAAFVAMLFLWLLFTVAAKDAEAQREGSRVPGSAALAWILAIGCCLTLLANEKDPVRDVLGNAVHQRLFYRGDQWKVGIYLQQKGLRPGDKVAVMSDLVSATLSTWAYMDQLQIVGVLGGSLAQTQTLDYDAFWNSAPVRQQQILANFRDAGARAVVSISKPAGAGAQDWEPVPGTAYWVYWLQAPDRS